MHIILLLGVSGQPMDKAYSKLRRNLVDPNYAKSLRTSPVSSRRMCAMRCSLDDICTLFQFKDGHCELFKLETEPGIGIISLANMTDIWRLDIGKATCVIGVEMGFIPHNTALSHSYFKSTLLFKHFVIYNVT